MAFIRLHFELTLVQFWH
ncbi:hypothetical protein LINPERHAP1_LOCUS25828 [Linum perenne]